MLTGSVFWPMLCQNQNSLGPERVQTSLNLSGLLAERLRNENILVRATMTDLETQHSSRAPGQAMLKLVAPLTSHHIMLSSFRN